MQNPCSARRASSATEEVGARHAGDDEDREGDGGREGLGAGPGGTGGGIAYRAVGRRVDEVEVAAAARVACGDEVGVDDGGEGGEAGGKEDELADGHACVLIVDEGRRARTRKKCYDLNALSVCCLFETRTLLLQMCK